MDPLTLRIAQMAPDDPSLVDLIAHHQAHGADEYPAESTHNMNGATLAAEGVRLFVATADEAPIAIGGWRPFDAASAELKSMHVVEAARGRGAGARIVEAILGDAKAKGRAMIFLETGSRDIHAPARRLYERAGFTSCPPFGSYVEDPNSVFMARAL